MLLRIHTDAISTAANPKPDARKVVNRYVDGKPQGAWRDRELTREEFITELNKGYAFSFNTLNVDTSAEKPRYSLKEAWGFAIDIDTLTPGKTWRDLPEGVLRDVGLVYQSPSYTEENQKCRLLYFFTEPVSDFKALKEIVCDRMALVGVSKEKADESCKDVTRFFYGNRFGDAGVMMRDDAIAINPSELLSEIRSRQGEKVSTRVTGNSSDTVTEKVLRLINDYFVEELKGDIERLYAGWDLEAKEVPTSEGQINRWHCSNPFSETNQSRTSLCITWFDNGLPPVFNNQGIEGCGGSIIDWHWLVKRKKLNPQSELPVQMSKRSWRSALDDLCDAIGMEKIDLRTLGSNRQAIDRQAIAEEFWSEGIYKVIRNGAVSFWAYDEKHKYWQSHSKDSFRMDVLAWLETKYPDFKMAELMGMISYIIESAKKQEAALYIDEFLASQQNCYNFKNGVLVDGVLHPHSPEYWTTYAPTFDYIPPHLRAADVEKIARGVFSTYFPYDNDAQILIDFSKLIVHGKQHKPRKYLTAFGNSGTGKTECFMLLCALYHETSGQSGLISADDYFGNSFNYASAATWKVLLLDEAQTLNSAAMRRITADVTSVTERGAVRSINAKYQPVSKQVVPQLILLTAEHNPLGNSTLDGLYRRQIMLKPRDTSLQSAGLLQERFWEQLTNPTVWASWVSYLADCFDETDEIVRKYEVLDEVRQARCDEAHRDNSDLLSFIEERLVFDPSSRLTREELSDAYFTYSTGKPPEMAGIREFERRQALTQLGKKLATKGVKTSQFNIGGVRKRGFVGVRLANEAEVVPMDTSFEKPVEVLNEPPETPQQNTIEKAAISPVVPGDCAGSGDDLDSLDFVEPIGAVVPTHSPEKKEPTPAKKNRSRGKKTTSNEIDADRNGGKKRAEDDDSSEEDFVMPKSLFGDLFS